MKTIKILPWCLIILLISIKTIANTVESSVQFHVTAIKESNPSLILSRADFQNSILKNGMDNKYIMQIIKQSVKNANKSGTKVVLMASEDKESNAHLPHIRVTWPINHS